MMDTRRLVTLAFLLITVLALLVFGASTYVLELPIQERSDIYLYIAALTGVATFLAALKDIIELIERLFGRGNTAVPLTTPSHTAVFILQNNTSITQIASLYRHHQASSPPLVDLQQQNGESRTRPDWHQGMLRSISLNEVLGQGQRLIITGGPGSGKTTVLLHIVHTLTVAIGSDHPMLVQENLGLLDEVPLPIFIPLSAYADHRRHLAHAPTPLAPHETTLATFISHYLIEQQPGFDLPSNFFEQLLTNGRSIILLLDGLDEVPDESERVQVREAIEQLVDGRSAMRIVVTCRSAAYKGRTALGRNFREVRVKPLEVDHIEALVTQAYAHIYAYDAALQADKRAELLQAIQNLEKGRQQRLGQQAQRLIDSPLLVRMLLIVHFSERRLPEQRAELYMKATDAMLLPEYGPDETVVNQIGRLVGDSRERHRDLVQHLAFHMHTQGEQQGREIEEEALRALLEAEPDYAPLVDDFIALTRLRGTLLEERLGVYRFIHLAFQEYLAARYLAEVIRSVDEIVILLVEEERLLDSWWREVILLISGYLHVTSPHTAQKFLHCLATVDRKLVKRRTLNTAIQIAAAELAAVGLLEWPETREALRQTVQTRLGTLFERPNDLKQAQPPLRAAAGVALALVGDTRPSVLDVDKMPFCFVPQEDFWMGNDTVPINDDWQETLDSEKPRHQLALPYDYYISRYPVTNAQFNTFVQAGGYEETSYWPEAKAAELWRPGETKKWYLTADNEVHEDWFTRAYDWGTPFNLDNHPIVGVSWYESLAFCRWLSQQWQQQGWLPDGWQVQLPSEAEWAKAARGGLYIPMQRQIITPVQLAGDLAIETYKNRTPKRLYPWGNSLEAEALNCKESGIGTSNAVGCFPQGRSPYGCEEMVGNVWEWTRTLWGEFDKMVDNKATWKHLFTYPYQIDDGRENLMASIRWPRTLRGGSYFQPIEQCRGGFRLRYFPHSRTRLVHWVSCRRVVPIGSDL